MPVFTETNRQGDVLKREWDPLYNRETVTVLAGQNLRVGAVLGRITASGKVRAIQHGASDGSQTACGVLVARDIDATAADQVGVMLARGPAVVAESALVWPAGSTAPQIAAATATLASLEIVARKAF